MGTNVNILSRFHPRIAQWFVEQMGRPTDVQEQAWPRIAAGEHVLIIAPTGSGKTLAAFLWAINQLATEEWVTGHTNVHPWNPELEDQTDYSQGSKQSMLKKLFAVHTSMPCGSASR